MPRHSIEAESNEIKAVSLAKAAEALPKAERIVRWGSRLLSRCWYVGGRHESNAVRPRWIFL